MTRTILASFRALLRAAGVAGALLFCGAVGASSTRPLPPMPPRTASLTPPADPGHFEFVVGGDNRSTGHGDPMPPSLDEICREIGIIRPPFVFWTGDLIEGYGDTAAEANAEYDTFQRAVSLSGTPFFNVPGNHEFSLDTSLIPVYLKRMGPLYGSFDYGNSHFVGLNSTAVEANGTVKPGSIDAAQWAWLQSDLATNQSAKNIFVFLHHYVFGPPVDDPALDSGWVERADRDRFHALMVKYGVRAVFCGHNHIYWHGNKDGIDYYISGGAGAPLDADPDQGGYLHYLVVHVDKKKVNVDILQPWHLTEVPAGAAAAPAAPKRTDTELVINTNHSDVAAAGIVFHVATPPPGTRLRVDATVHHKKTAKANSASIVSVVPAAAGTVAVTVQTDLPADRSTEITVGP